jgi:hypothetical protein
MYNHVSPREEWLIKECFVVSAATMERAFTKARDYVSEKYDDVDDKAEGGPQSGHLVLQDVCQYIKFWDSQEEELEWRFAWCE